MSATIKATPRLKKKHRSKDELTKNENVPQVHQTIKKEAPSIKDDKSETTAQSEDLQEVDSSNESNRTFILEDQNENHSTKAISRDISIDTGGQINSKIEKGIIGLIESEIIKEKTKYSHFSDSRPQSLSFYEDDNPPEEELTGNLQPLSPDEKRHYRKRFDQEDNEVVLDLQETELREKDQRQGSSGKKSKSRRKKHNTEDPEPGMGDSTEIILPKEKRKSKKSKKRDYSPSMSNSDRKKYKKKPYGGCDTGNDVIVSLEDLQDDVFERDRGDGKFLNYSNFNSEAVIGGSVGGNSQSKSPRHNNGETQKIYFQKRNKFELGTNNETNPLNMTANIACSDTCDENDLRCRDDALIIAIRCQHWWSKLTLFFHGLFGGVAFAHLLLVLTSRQIMEHFVLYYYGDYAECYTILFFLLNVVCLVAVFDRFDVSHLNASHLRDLVTYHKGCITVFLYAVCLMVHLITMGLYDRVLIRVGDIQKKRDNKSFEDLQIPDQTYDDWYRLTIWRDILAFLCWLIISFLSCENFLHLHLSKMVKYIIKSPNY